MSKRRRKSLGFANKTIGELGKIAKRVDDPARIRDIIGHIEARAGHRDRLAPAVAKLKRIERDLIEQRNRTKQSDIKTTGRILEPVKKLGAIHNPDGIHWIERVSHMSFAETLNLWRNCNRALSRAGDHQKARMILSAIEEGWSRKAQSCPGYFEWPKTDAELGSNALNTRDWLHDGMLTCLGYRVGMRGVSAAERQLILDGVFQGPLPPAFPLNYMDQWSSADTPARLRKLAETIASFAKNGRKRRNAQMESAIADWERDLEYLYHKYYAGRFGFAWPTSKLS